MKGATKEGTVGQRRTGTVGILLIVAVGDAPSARPIGTAGSTEADHHRSQHSGPRRSGTAARGTATDDASWRGSDHCTGVCSDPRQPAAFPVWQTDRKLRGVNSQRSI